MSGITHVYESLPKEALPTLRLSSTLDRLVCSNCGEATNSLLPVCLWCFSDESKLEAPASQPRPSYTRVSLHKGEQPYGGFTSRTTELLLGSQDPTSTIPMPVQPRSLPHSSALGQSRLSIDLRDESLMDALSASFPSLLKQGDFRHKEEATFRPEDDAPTRLITPSVVNQHVAMSYPSIPRATSVESLGAGSSSSSTRGLRFRSRSLFSLTISSRLNTPPQDTTATTTSSMNAAKSVARRISSSTHLRSQPTPEHNNYIHEERPPTSDSDSDALSSKDRSLRRRRRLNGAAPIPTLPPASSLKRISISSLHTQSPIAISLSLNQSRPGTAESASSSSGEAVATQEILSKSVVFTPGELSSVPASAQQQQHQARSPSVRWSTEDKEHASEKTTGGVPPIRESPTPTSSPRNSMAEALKPPRVGHPSRPYYSAIRKHCMSSPASSRPSSVDHGRGGLNTPLPKVPRERPTSSSGAHPPSAFIMPTVTPFTRRPVSISSLPSSAQITDSSVSRGGASLATKGMSVFDIEDDVILDDEEEEDPQPKRKPSSLSRAFSRGSQGSGKKKRRWSSSLFSESAPSVKETAKGDASSPSQSRRTSQGLNPMDRMGISMSGETELRMALALMQQQEEAAEALQADQQQQEGTSTSSHHQQHGMAPKPEKERKYRFRQTLDLSGQHEPRSSTAFGYANEKLFKGKGRKDEDGAGRLQQPVGVFDRMKKLKRGLKGFLTNNRSSTSPIISTPPISPSATT